MNTEEAAPVLNGFDEVSAVTTTSATLEDITGLTFNLTTTVSGRIWAIMSIDSSSNAGNNTTGGWAVSINGVDGTEATRFLSGTNDDGMGSVQGYSGVLTPGTYTVKGRHRRVSGNATINTNAQLFAIFVAS